MKFALSALFICTILLSCNQDSPSTKKAQSQEFEGKYSPCECYKTLKLGYNQQFRDSCLRKFDSRSWTKAFEACAEKLAAEGVEAVKPTYTSQIGIADGHYEFDIVQSQVIWTGTKITGSKNNGTLNIKSGSIDFLNGQPLGGLVVMDMKSIKCLDLDGEAASDLEAHLKSDEFFNAKKHPQSTFVLSEIEQVGNDDYKVRGNLTIKGYTQPEEAELFIRRADDGKLMMAGILTFDRSEYDVRFGSDSFFSELGEHAINDEVQIGIKLTLRKASN